MNRWWMVVVMAMLLQVVQAEEPTRLPPVTVTEEVLLEDVPVGPNRQPSWTTDGRLSGTTRAYVLPPWHVEFTQWWRPELPRGGGSEHLFQEEIEIGLPYRFQLDVYENWKVDDDGTVFQDGNQVEVRWAFAEWGVIPLNPTVYAEWKFKDEAADAYEIKLLLSEVLAPRWHWGANLTFERQIGDDLEEEWAASTAVTYTLIDRVLSAGCEAVVEQISERGDRNDPAVEVLVGPSLQWQPSARVKLDLVPLFGVTGDAPHLKAYVLCSFNLGRIEPGEARTPVSLKGD